MKSTTYVVQKARSRLNWTVVLWKSNLFREGKKRRRSPQCHSGVHAVRVYSCGVHWLVKICTAAADLFFPFEVGSAQNTDAPKSKQPIATVAGQAIYEDELLSTVKGQLFPLRNQEYEIKKRPLDSLIEQKLLEAAAKKMIKS